jgi:hypothetical protein
MLMRKTSKLKFKYIKYDSKNTHQNNKKMQKLDSLGPQE